MTDSERRELRLLACDLRRNIIEAVYGGKSGHPGGSLSSADLFTYLYAKELNVRPEDPKWPERDRFVLSKGHTSPGLYSALAMKGFISAEELKTFRHSDSRLQGHPSMKTVPGVDMSTGSLGQGVSTAVGMALGARLSGGKWRVYALLGDGELQEGEVWEAMMSAAHYHLSNLCLVIDNNGLQIDGEISKVMSPYPIVDKVKAFGLNVIEIDGHNFDEIEAAFAAAKACTDRPSCIVMHTTKGKGVSFMEGQAGWHGKAPNAEQYETALAEIAKAKAEVEAQ